MTTHNPANPLTLEAAEDFTNFRYSLVVVDSDGKAALPSAATLAPFGVIQNTPITGGEAHILPLGSGGSSKIYLGATLDEGAMASMEASTGYAIAATSGSYRIGPVMQGGADTEVGEILLNTGTVDA
jgi:hypothetical protein